MPRDFSKPYSAKEIEGLKDVFRKLPTYKPGGWVKASDIAAIIKAMEYPRTPQQVAAYQEHWEKHYGGIVTMEGFIESVSSVHSTSEYARDLAIKMDANGDGKITSNEFEELVKLMVMHDPKLEGIPYETFLGEADTNNDGIVSVDECTEWIRKKCEAAK